MFVVLDPVWARVGSHPWWPGLVCHDPEAGDHRRVKPRAGQRPVQECHVTFFGENTRAWVVSYHCFRSRNVHSELLFQDERNLKQFEGLEKYLKEKTRLLDKASGKSKQKIVKAYTPSEAIQPKWLASVRGADTVLSLSPDYRMEKMIDLNNEIALNTVCKKKRKLSIDTDTDEMNNKQSNKKIKLEPSESEESCAVTKGATRRQRDVIQQKEQKERRDKEKGPAWTYELVPVNTPAPVTPPVFGQFVSGRACVKCEEPGGQVWRCRGQCSAHYHPACVGLNSDKVGVDQFRCENCRAGRHVCAVCRQSDGGKLTRCHVSGCGKFFHDTCLTKFTIWPQHKIVNGAIYCPDHTCHTCASENPRDPIMKYNEKLMHCIRCPTAYHAGDHCVAAGTVQLTKTDIICPKHYTPPLKSKKGTGAVHVNTNWCFICSQGGSLVLCDNCPASFHEECLGLGEPVGDKYYCEDCQSGQC